GDVMTAVGKSFRNHLYCAIAVPLRRDLPETIDNPAAFAIAHDCNSHTGIPPVKSVIISKATASFVGSPASVLERTSQTFPPGIGSHRDRSIGTPMHALNRSHGISVHSHDSINGEMLA